MQCRVCWEPSVLSICTKCNDEAKEQARVMNRNSQQPAQEEKEMGVSLITSCAECGTEYEIDSPHDCPMSLVRDLRQRWDKAFFAALTGRAQSAGTVDAIVSGATSVANETICRHADMMDGRDRIIAEVVG